ncbi:MAG: hypothetical protein FWE68_03915 [Defluviitaleaceae bacterium]|nr:hypothetical protein [Defluviitaleaceae bacterium]
MVCLKCKTAIEEGAKVCPYCKKKFAADRQFINIALLGMMALLTSATLLHLTRTADEATLGRSSSVLPRPAVEVVPAPPSVPAPPEPMMMPATPTPPPHNIDTGRRDDEVWALTENLAVTMHDYYERNSRSRVILSKNGYMYNFPARSYYTPRSFTRIESMNQEYADEQALLLFMRPSSLAVFLPDAGLDGNELTLFCGYETRAGITIAGREGRLGIISRENFQTLLAEYSDERGGVRRHRRDSPEFTEIVRAAGRFKNNFERTPEDFDVRYLASDSKYAFVVLSERHSPAVLEMFVLLSGPDGWRVDFSGFENMFMYQKKVNARYPDFNIGMLPPFNLYYAAQTIRSDVTPLIEAMRVQGVITEEDGDAVFATGTEKFCYMEFENGRKLLAVFTGHETGWMVYTAEDSWHAEVIMATYETDPPTFILKQ